MAPSGITSGFWRRTPPALFPSTLGMFGLALAWRTATEIGAPRLAADLLLAVAGAFFVFAFGAYIAKLVKRPSVVLEDMNPAPGRAAVSAGSMCLLLFAAAAYGAGAKPETARTLWLAGLVLHAVYMACVVHVLWKAPPETRVVTPVLFLPFVGFIVSPIGGVPLGFVQISEAAYLWSLAGGAVIVALSTPRFFLQPTPVPQRASAAILLAPTSVAAIAGGVLGHAALADAFALASALIAVFLATRLRWLTAGGFTPLWGAFTFPAAAFAGAMLLLATTRGGLWVGVAWGALAIASVVVPAIWALTIRAWAKGRLAAATGAGTV